MHRTHKYFFNVCFQVMNSNARRNDASSESGSITHQSQVFFYYAHHNMIVALCLLSTTTLPLNIYHELLDVDSTWFRLMNVLLFLYLIFIFILSLFSEFELVVVQRFVVLTAASELSEHADVF